MTINTGESGEGKTTSILKMKEEGAIADSSKTLIVSSNNDLRECDDVNFDYKINEIFYNLLGKDVHILITTSSFQI